MREQADQHAADQRRQQHDAPVREPGRQARSDRNRHRENGEKERDHAGGAADIMFRQGRQHRQDDDADEPEPARHQRAPPQPPIGAHVFDQVDGRGGDVGIDLQIRRAFAGARDEQARDPGSGCRDQHQPGEMEGSPPSPAAKPATMVPIRMAMNVPPSTSALPAGQFFALQMIGQDAVFDRAEQRGDHAVEKDREEQHGDRVKREADHRHDGDGDFEQLQSARHDGLVEAVGNLAAEAGQKEEREGERRGRELDQARRLRPRRAGTTARRPAPA